MATLNADAPQRERSLHSESREGNLEAGDVTHRDFPRDVNEVPDGRSDLELKYERATPMQVQASELAKLKSRTNLVFKHRSVNSRRFQLRVHSPQELEAHARRPQRRQLDRDHPHNRRLPVERDIARTTANRVRRARSSSVSRDAEVDVER